MVKGKAVAAILIAALSTAPAGAMVYHELGASAYAISMGGASVAGGLDPSLIYWNPALLALLDGNWAGLTATGWAFLLVGSPNYSISGGLWLPKLDSGGWEAYPFPVSGGASLDLGWARLGLVCMDIGGWRETGAGYSRQRFCVSYNACLAFALGDYIKIGLNPKLVQMTDILSPDAGGLAAATIHYAFGASADAGILFSPGPGLSAGLSVMAPFGMLWDDQAMVFAIGGARDTGRWEDEPLLARAGVSVGLAPGLRLACDLSYIAWSLYDAAANDSLQCHLGLEAGAGFLGLPLPLRAGLCNENLPWSGKERWFLSAGTSVPLAGCRLDMAVEACVVPDASTDRLYTLTLSLVRAFGREATP